MNESPLKAKSFELALKTIKLSNHLKRNKKEWIISNQLLRSATSIGANLEEGIGAYTIKEFSHKLGLTYKELRETKYWLKLLLHSNLINKTQFSETHSICE